MGDNAEIRQMKERGKARKALFDLFAESETQVSADRSELRYAPLADRADAFIDAMAGYVEARRRAAAEPDSMARVRLARGGRGEVDAPAGRFEQVTESAHKSHYGAPDTRAMPNGNERPGEHWNARLIREARAHHSDDYGAYAWNADIGRHKRGIHPNQCVDCEPHSDDYVCRGGGE